MSQEQPKVTLPTELINEKTFYTLGGASAGVLLICWVIGYVAPENWLNYKTYRLIGLVLSEIFAFIIMVHAKEKKASKWIFAILNGILIFVNASGVNIITSSGIFNQKEIHSDSTVAYFHFQNFRSDPLVQAGIFPIPHMINWWPDEKLIEATEKLTQENKVLQIANQTLRTKILLHDTTSSLQTPSLQVDVDSLMKQCSLLGDTIISIKGKLKQYNARNEELTILYNSTKDSLRLRYLSSEILLDRLRKHSQVGLLKSFVDRYKGRTKVLAIDPAESLLVKQDFYKKMQWDEFCKYFDQWYSQILTKSIQDGEDINFRK